MQHVLSVVCLALMLPACGGAAVVQSSARVVPSGAADQPERIHREVGGEPADLDRGAVQYSR